ncbi:MAG: helix-turn-helix domain-containing protein [Ruminococcaceae bacterium]|nr:helix-turn-helix domain-containing protein [Oscillospiraceae bacterium]
MNMFIDRDKLIALLRDFYLLTNIPVGIYDKHYHPMACYPLERSPYCSCLHEYPEAMRRCVACDNEAFEKSGKLGRLYTYRCYAGLQEAVLPLLHNQEVIGYITIGQIRKEEWDIKQMEEAWKKLEAIGVDIKRLREAYSRQKPMGEKVLRAAFNIMHACSSYLYLDGIITVREMSAVERLDAFIEENLDEGLSVETLCDALSVSKARLYTLFEERYGMGVAEYIRICRVNKAKKMLLETRQPISAVAAQCGFPDYNYFTKVFKRYCGVSPRDYRKTNTLSEE